MELEIIVVKNIDSGLYDVVAINHGGLVFNTICSCKFKEDAELISNLLKNANSIEV